MKTTYVHIQTPNGRSLGFSAKLSSEDGFGNILTNLRGDKMCFIALTSCNRKDRHFNKKIARAVLETKPETLVRVRDVPSLLADAANLCEDPEGLFESNEFNYILRRFV